MAESIRSVIDHARNNGGVITRSEALALGISARTLRRRVSEGILVDISPGVLALPGAADTHVLDLHAACRKLNATVSHESAAFIHDLDRPSFVKPTVSVPVRQSKEMLGVTVHQLTDLSDAHVTFMEDLRVTTPERTIIDLAAVLNEGHLARILDQGLARGKISMELLTELFSNLARRGKPGTVKLRRLIEARGEGYVPPESELERRLVKVLDRAGLPEPVRQFEAPWLRPVNGRVDLAYPDGRLLIEGDSRRWHQLIQAFETDRLRDNAAQLAGWRILRFTWREIEEYPERVVRTVHHALED